MSKSSIEDFDVLSRLGSGSYGVVFKVRRRTDDKIYVIKTSPFVVHYFDSFISGESLHLVMEYCNKGDLQGLIKKAKEKERTFLPEDLTWDMALQIILGLHYLHGKKILHRDLKAANVFLMKDRDHPFFLVKIGDLGVAKLLDTSTAFAQTIVGTPYYLSPELCADQPYRDKSDCWALGVLLYECCTLRHPFEARNQCALIMKIIQTPVKSPASESVSDELSELILWLLAKDPAKRSSTRDILNEKTIRKKLEEHGYELPTDIGDSTTTNYLSRNSATSTASSSPSNIARKGFTAKDLPPPPPPSLEGTAKSTMRGRGSTVASENYHTLTKSPSIDRMGGSPAAVVRGGKVVLRGGQVTSPSPRERGVIGNMEINGKKSGFEKEVGVRGDRVRGLQKLQSDKARQRYQVRSPAAVTPPPGSQKAKSYFDYGGNVNEQLDDTIIGSSKGGNVAESKISSPLDRRFSFKQEDGRSKNRKDYKNQSTEVSPETYAQPAKNKTFEYDDDDDEDFNNAATLVTKIGAYRNEVDTVFQFHQDDKDDGDGETFSRKPDAGSRYLNSHDDDIDAEYRAGLHVLTGDDDQNDDPLCQTLSTALNGSYVPMRAPNLEDDYYKDDFDEPNFSEESESDYDDEVVVVTDTALKVKKGPSPTEDDKTLSKKPSRRSPNSSLKMPARSDVSPYRGRRSPEAFLSNEDDTLSPSSKDSFGGEERTSRRSLQLANALSKDAAKLSFMHREKENSGRGTKDRRGLDSDKNDDDDDDDDLFGRVLDSNRSLLIGTGRTSVTNGKDALLDPGSPTGDDDPNFDDEEGSGRKMKALEREIDEARNVSISILGHELFSDIYDLCVIGMYSVTDKVQSTAKKDEEERHREKLYAQLQSIGVTALDLVSTIKTLIAKESNLNAIKERLKLIHRYK